MADDILDTEDWLGLVDRLGGAQVLDHDARKSGAFTRARAVGSAVDLLRLCFAYGPGGLSLRAVSGWARATGLAQLSDVAVMERLQKCDAWLGAMLGTLLSKEVPPIPTKRPVRIVDGSVVAQAGPKTCGEVGLWRLHALYDPGAERFEHLTLTDQRGGERFDRADVTAGEIRIGDRAYLQPDRIAQVIDAGGDILVRAPWRNARWLDGDGKRLDIIALLRGTTEDMLDLPIQIARRKGPPLQGLRLVAIRKNEASAGKARAKAAQASKKGRHVLHEGTVTAAGWILLVTSLDDDTFDAQEVGDLYRIRWQVEIAFKRLKSLAGYRTPPAKEKRLARVFLLAHLIFALIADETRTQMRDSFP